MSVRVGLAALLAVLAGCASTGSGNPPAAQFTGAALASACAGRDGWSDPAPPARIFGNVHYVGTCGITALLVTSSDGHVLIDGATPQAAPGIAANIRRLGFDLRDVRTILISHEHVDHVGGVAALKRMTGAQVVARAEARAVLESGKADPADPQAGTIPDFEGFRVDRVVEDGDEIGRGYSRITAHRTPGHTAGSTSWRWDSCEKRVCHGFVYADSISAVGPDTYRFTDHPELIARFRSTFNRIGSLWCDILVTPHPSASNLFPRLAGSAPLVDQEACPRYAETGRQRLEARLAREVGR
jgi:metallo-beta-lactamase class B